MTAQEKIAIIIPTKDRLDDLSRLLESIARQGAKPAQIIVVDGGLESVKNILNRFSGLDIEHIRITPPSLTAQRNAGIKAVRQSIGVIIFLDDDVVLKEGSLESMIDFWNGAPKDVGGASFNLVNEIYRKPSLLERLFLVSRDTPNTILRSGFQGKISFVDRDIPAEWLVGCAMAFRRKVFDEFMFDEWFSGYARYEDVDFTYRVGRKYKMFVVADAQVEHFNKPENAELSFALGRMEVLNRLHFVRKNPDLSVALCYWALCGILLNNIVKGILSFDKRCINRAWGNASGFLCSASCFYDANR